MFWNETEVSGRSERNATNASCEAFGSVNVSLAASDTALRTTVRSGMKAPDESVLKKLPPNPYTPGENALKVTASLDIVGLSQISLPLPDG